jgi:hypothetical protein
VPAPNDTPETADHTLTSSERRSPGHDEESFDLLDAGESGVAEPEHLAGMEHALHIFEASVEDGHEFETSLRALHSAVAAATGNP